MITSKEKKHEAQKKKKTSKREKQQNIYNKSASKMQS